jgi:adenylate cyclase
MMTMINLLWPQVLLVEPPETHFLSTLLYGEFMVFAIVGRICLHQRKFVWGAGLTFAGLNLHIMGLCIAYADDPAHILYFILMVFPFIMITSRHMLLRWSFAILTAIFFLIDQVYYRSLNGQGLFGPPKWTGPVEYFLPPLVLGCIVFIILMNSFVKAVKNAEDGLIQEHAASEKLLRNILPDEIAGELKASGASEPKYFAATTVCFTDFVGFTKISESMSPRDLVRELDQCFSYFDNVMGHYNLEKLKTIGDSYMFVGGLPAPSATHAIDCVLASLEIQAFMNQMKEIKSQQGLPYWELRLGIHSGDLVAGVIGEKKFAYDVWSDTVNTASRCESSGISGRINISKGTYELIKEFFQCEYRGAVPAKHKGEIDMYLVTGLLPEYSVDGACRVPNPRFLQRHAEMRKAMA